MLKKRVATVLATASFAGLLGVGAAQAAPSSPQSLSVTAVVVDQQCQGGDFVNVTLGATVQTSSQAAFKWDFTNNGTFDTRALSNPQVTHRYPDEVNVTARIGARNLEGNSAQDTISFSTLRCP